MDSHAHRLAILARQVTSAGPQLERNDTEAPEEARPAPGGGRGALTVVDQRTGKQYKARWRGRAVAGRNGKGPNEPGRAPPPAAARR